MYCINKQKHIRIGTPKIYSNKNICNAGVSLHAAAFKVKSVKCLSRLRLQLQRRLQPIEKFAKLSFAQHFLVRLEVACNRFFAAMCWYGQFTQCLCIETAALPICIKVKSTAPTNLAPSLHLFCVRVYMYEWETLKCQMQLLYTAVIHQAKSI